MIVLPDPFDAIIQRNLLASRTTTVKANTRILVTKKDTNLLIPKSSKQSFHSNTYCSARPNRRQRQCASIVLAHVVYSTLPLTFKCSRQTYTHTHTPVYLIHECRQGWGNGSVFEIDPLFGFVITLTPAADGAANVERGFCLSQHPNAKKPARFPLRRDYHLSRPR